MADFLGKADLHDVQTVPQDALKKCFHTKPTLSLFDKLKPLISQQHSMDFSYDDCTCRESIAWRELNFVPYQLSLLGFQHSIVVLN